MKKNINRNNNRNNNIRTAHNLDSLVFPVVFNVNGIERSARTVEAFEWYMEGYKGTVLVIDAYGKAVKYSKAK